MEEGLSEVCSGEEQGERGASVLTGTILSTGSLYGFIDCPEVFELLSVQRAHGEDVFCLGHSLPGLHPGEEVDLELIFNSRRRQQM